LNWGLLAMILVDRLGKIQGDAGIGCDNASQLLYAKRNRGVVVSLTEGRNHGTTNVADLCVVQDAFKAIADFDAILRRVHDDQH